MTQCNFCSNTAITYNKQKIPVCNKCRKEILTADCPACGEPLNINKGRFGVYFSCFEHGNFSLAKVKKLK